MGPLIRDCVKPPSSTLCHVEVLKSPFARDGGPLLPCPPSNGCQWWAQNLPPFLLIASGDAMATRREQKSGSPHHSMHALASMAKHLKSSISVCQRRDNWEGFNVEPPSPSLLLFFYALYPHTPTLPPPLTEASSLHCYGSKCEAVIKLWLLCFKGLALSQSSPPCVTSLNQALSGFHSSRHRRRQTEPTITTLLKFCLRIPAFVQHMAWQLSCAIAAQRDDCLATELSGELCGRLWKRARWVAL